MTAILILLAAALLVAYANGANDNFKGVATLYGSGTVGYRKALAWASVTTLAGSLLSVVLAEKLVKAFSAKGLVPDAIAAQPEFLAAVAFGAAMTVLSAALLGFPISTTHALTGALIGAGLLRAGSAVDFSHLGKSFFLPLAVSPVLAVFFGGIAFLVLRACRRMADVWSPSGGGDLCVCLQEGRPIGITAHSSAAVVLDAPPLLPVTVGTTGTCAMHAGPSLVLSGSSLLNAMHFLSSGAVSFARGLNDTPKIVGLLVVVQLLDLRISLGLIAAVMVAGGLLNARKVAETVSKRITSMKPAEGFAANLVTSTLVIAASGSGLPVSTTHVSCSAIFGMGLFTGKADKNVIGQILMSWLLTLPIAGLIAAAASSLLS